MTSLFFALVTYIQVTTLQAEEMSVSVVTLLKVTTLGLERCCFPFRKHFISQMVLDCAGLMDLYGTKKVCLSHWNNAYFLLNLQVLLTRLLLNSYFKHHTINLQK